MTARAESRLKFPDPRRALLGLSSAPAVRGLAGPRLVVFTVTVEAVLMEGDIVVVSNSENCGWLHFRIVRESDNRLVVQRLQTASAVKPSPFVFAFPLQTEHFVEDCRWPMISRLSETGTLPASASPLYTHLTHLTATLRFCG
ncbi:hypothetical protein E1B28_009710 [Marasmius oreades]|uniref:Uncharacterized protein n=1 Tax=Marasmius oreades TaxID=181124 RepID=A0A9P7RW88_9AGAR|nr:uncharacterized protein E1B28_009710 [Marasmius oreades]KAG7090608.1 hypothetical protein E1B28_009710 [Marasmius oreades]